MDKSTVRISYSNKAGHRLLNVSYETEVENAFVKEIMDEKTQMLMDHVDAKLDSLKAEETIKEQFPASSPDNVDEGYGLCNKCGSARVKNPKTGKIFCKDKCWLKG